MNYDLKGKVVAITGGTTGIGEAIAVAYAEQGCKVAVCGRSPDKITALQDKFCKLGYPLHAVSVDVRDNGQLKGFVDSTVQAYGTLNVFINNAGINIQKPFHQLPEEDWYKVVDTNFKSVFYGSAYASDHMKKIGGGVIINTSSFNAIIPTAGRAIYCATKWAVESLTKVFSVELAKFNIRVVSVAPGYTVTPQTQWEIDLIFDELVSRIPVKKLASTEDIVAAYLFVASDAANYINGVSLPVTGAKLCTQNPNWSWEQPEGSL
ncbi:MAG: SDR family NAD(P)-dependent oxidoreductase [Christensenellales bacterium]